MIYLNNVHKFLLMIPKCCLFHVIRLSWSILSKLSHSPYALPYFSLFSLGTRSSIHPSFLTLGVDFDEDRIWGSNEKCLAFLSSCEELIRSFIPKSPTERMNNHTGTNDALFCRSFGPVLQAHVNFLQLCRPLSVTIHNAYQYLKQTLTRLDSVEDWDEVWYFMIVCYALINVFGFPGLLPIVNINCITFLNLSLRQRNMDYVIKRHK